MKITFVLLIVVAVFAVASAHFGGGHSGPGGRYSDRHGHGRGHGHGYGSSEEEYRRRGDRYGGRRPGLQSEEEKNKRIVRQYTQELFGNKDLSSIDRYLAPGYIQHNPTVADGPEALKAAAREWFKDDNTKITVDIKRISAEGNLVWVHTKDKNEEGKVMSVVDIYRVENGKIQEHWDVMQVMPETAKNDHPLF